MCVADIMIANPITVSPANSIGTAVRRMRASGCLCLPVVEGDRLVGIVTDHELSRAANLPLVARSVTRPASGTWASCKTWFTRSANAASPGKACSSITALRMIW
ncbi:MAG: CBS domain-containing protein [Chloroflexi bacterium]|nr:CBS domain-containing protein [Chloroflexota bacterium]